ncbi:PREDICTED: WUSCHEL-related homeobox 4-like [Nelumbo nucifera]|uniref:WUSCHEL-related homeobox 4-like n=2 Tax=Nelumbo nucifera TaxID=4432 RepID=A0A1U8AS26_NELNU|nr:PREDICTED: WUSCHEL-related homeobox 4-like [Nelumbo nucifera]XP_010270564.1 PREDICTED: WUSCHEL-related homeobox 4-like [Nelumbo nucifera]XP_010270572.1 PREDICTED: WUSCHEL-related homeobox 4-like [Nelumbo nucifera]DAD41333.1 TPA_asm: hypothetical protein HUJ06_015656 [Nelumbo nucifera]
MRSLNMKVHQLARGLWEHEPSLTLGCKRLRPLAPKLTNGETPAILDLKSFIKPESSSGPSKSDDKREAVQVDAPSGGTRWNPTQEQIGILEMLYRGGMRTPNAQQIEKITAQLGKFGKIEGKNVFYWFQNHKARERQKQKRNSLGLVHSPRTPPATTVALDVNRDEIEREEDSHYKRKHRGWAIEFFQQDRGFCGGGEEGDKTLELFPLHPEGR